jgi:hypothetical protein
VIEVINSVNKNKEVMLESMAEDMTLEDFETDKNTKEFQ